MKCLGQDSELLREVQQVIDLARAGRSLVLHTSGTTGTPKSVSQDLKRALEKKTGGTSDQRFLLAYSPARWAGVSVILHCLKSGCDLLVPRSLSIDDVIQAGIEFKANCVSLTPSLFRNMAIRNALHLIPIRQITFGGEYATQSTLDLAKNIWPSARVTHVYASTEFGDICAVSDGLEGFPESKFRAFKLEGTELVIDGSGTGDHWELRGQRYYFVGRNEEIINVGGNKVSPITVEEIALACGARFSRAYAITSPLMGQLVGLDYVGSIAPLDLKKAMSGKLPKYAVPGKLNQVDELVLSAEGKLRRMK